MAAGLTLSIQVHQRWAQDGLGRVLTLAQLQSARHRCQLQWLLLIDMWQQVAQQFQAVRPRTCLLYTSPSPRD